MKLKLPNWGSLCNPNLLTNSDWKHGIINQKGILNFAGIANGNRYTIDFWYIGSSVSCGLNVYNDYISVELPKNNNLGCFVYNPIDQNGVYTCAVKLRNKEMVILHSNKSVSGEEITFSFGNLQSGVKVALAKYAKYNSWNFYVINTNSSNVTLDIEYIKLEEGNYYTGMQPYNQDMEAFKCLWVMQITDLMGYPEYCNSNEIAFLVPIQRRMMKTPNISNNVENQSTGISVRKTDGTTVTGFTYEVNYMFKNAVRVVAHKNNHGLKMSDIGCIAFRGQSGFDSNTY